MTAALPEVVEGFSLLIFPTNWLPSMRLIGPLLNPTAMGSKGISTECMSRRASGKQSIQEVHAFWFMPY